MPVLLAMAGTRRFDSIAMFLEDGETAALGRLVAQPGADPADVAKVRAAYGL